jgi:hypothetical protein
LAEETLEFKAKGERRRGQRNHLEENLNRRRKLSSLEGEVDFGLSWRIIAHVLQEAQGVLTIVW